MKLSGMAPLHALGLEHAFGHGVNVGPGAFGFGQIGSDLFQHRLFAGAFKAAHLGTAGEVLFASFGTKARLSQMGQYIAPSGGGQVGGAIDTRNGLKHLPIRNII